MGGEDQGVRKRRQRGGGSWEDEMEEYEVGGDEGSIRTWEEVMVSCSTLTGGFVAAFSDSISAWVIQTLLVDCR